MERKNHGFGRILSMLGFGRPTVEQSNPSKAQSVSSKKPIEDRALSNGELGEVRLTNTGSAPVLAQCIDHVNLSVRDLDVSASFYANLLGLEIKEQGSGEGTRWCILGSRDRFYVCFFEVREASFRPNDIHINHVGFVVDDIDETVRRIHGLGIRLLFNDAPVQWPRSRSAYVTDPDGIMIEFTDRFGGALD
jgi:lactoylglutathione lyase